MAETKLDLVRRIAQNCFAGTSVRSYAPKQSAAELAGEAHQAVTAAIDCIIVGMESEGKQLLTDSLVGIQLAIEKYKTGEVISDITFEVDAYVDQLLCEWLLELPLSIETIKQPCAIQQQSLGSKSPKKKWLNWAWAFPVHLAAGEFQYIIDEFELFAPEDQRSEGNPPNEPEMAYIFAKHRLSPYLLEYDFIRLRERFLARYIPEWFEWGGVTHCALWVKLLFENATELTPASLLHETVAPILASSMSHLPS